MTFLGVLTRADGCVYCCDSVCATPTPTSTPFFDVQGRRIYQVNTGQLLIVVEGAKGLSNAAVGQSSLPGSAVNWPDIQIETTQKLGNGTQSTCANGDPAAGVPGINPPSFTPESTPGILTSALNSFGCQFDYYFPNAQCTWVGDRLNARYINLASTAQFCDQMSANAVFNFGDSIVTVRLRDVNGNTGPTAQIVVRVNTPTPRP